MQTKEHKKTLAQSSLFCKKVKGNLLRKSSHIIQEQAYDTLMGLLESTLQRKQVLYLANSMFLWKLKLRSKIHVTLIKLGY